MFVMLHYDLTLFHMLDLQVLYTKVAKIARRSSGGWVAPND